ncbi:MAG: multidrug efflux SMR transporter [Planctomycetota bacterium]
MAWVYLALAAGFEVLFAGAMKASQGFTRPGPTVLVVVGAVGGLGLLTLALKTLPVSVGYPIWVGAGSVGAVAVGVLYFGEGFSIVKLVSVLAIAAGAVGLQVSSEDVSTPLPAEQTRGASTPSP